MIDRTKVLLNASKYIGTKEVGSNGGTVIDKIQKVFGMQGQQYCVMFALYVLLETEPKLNILKTASSQSLFEWALKNGYTYTDPTKVKAGDIVIWRKFNLWQGHAGLIASQYDLESQTFKTIEGNTSNGDYGSQRDGDGIYKRIRNAGKVSWVVDNFYLRGFIDIDKIPLKA